MKKISSLLLILLLSFNSPCEAAKDSVLFGGAIQEPQIVINNRILVKVNGKAISVIDLMKKMDVMFYKQFPQYATSTPARFQFYQANWKNVLNEMIDKELILADAEEAKLPISQGDIRQEMESLFGPNIVTNLDKVGISFDEAAKMVRDDIIMRRMLYFRVHSKAMSQVTPQQIDQFYEKVARENIRDNEWFFNVLTIRNRDSTKAAETANLVHHLLADEKTPLNELLEKMKGSVNSSPKQSTVTISEEYQTNEKELSDAYKTILAAIPNESFSQPIVQKSRNDNSSVIRIFYRKKMIPGGEIPFSDLESKIKGKLTDDIVTIESAAYLKRMRQHFDVEDDHLEEVLSSDYQPFQLK